MKYKLVYKETITDVHWVCTKELELCFTIKNTACVLDRALRYRTGVSPLPHRMVRPRCKSRPHCSSPPVSCCYRPVGSALPILGEEATSSLSDMCLCWRLYRYIDCRSGGPLI